MEWISAEQEDQNEQGQMNSSKWLGPIIDTQTSRSDPSRVERTVSSQLQVGETARTSGPQFTPESFRVVLTACTAHLATVIYRAGSAYYLHLSSQ
jgi:hypothetical protein